MADERINWYRSPIDKAELRELTRKSDLRAFAQVIGQLGATFATGYGAWYSAGHWPWYATVGMVYLHGTLCGFLGMGGPAHELSHRTVFKTAFWNEFFLRVYCFLSWSNFHSFRASHTRHHAVTVFKAYDGEVVLPQKLRRIDWLYAFLGNPMSVIARFKGAWRVARGRLDSPWEKILFPEPDSKGRRETINWARLTLAGHIALLALFIATQQWMLILLVTCAGAYAGWLCYLCGVPQHFGLSPNVPDFRLSCRTYELNPIARFLYWNMNYHVEHHMYAAVPFYNLPKLRRLIEHDLPPANPGLWSTWREMLTIRRRQLEDPSYCHVPALPDTATPGRVEAEVTVGGEVLVPAPA